MRVCVTMCVYVDESMCVWKIYLFLCVHAFFCPMCGVSVDASPTYSAQRWLTSKAQQRAPPLLCPVCLPASLSVFLSLLSLSLQPCLLYPFQISRLLFSFTVMNYSPSSQISHRNASDLGPVNSRVGESLLCPTGVLFLFEPAIAAGRQTDEPNHL